MSKTFLSWNDFDFLSDRIADFYSTADLKLIVGLSRGGLPLAVKLSNALGIPMEPLVWQTRDGSKQDEEKLSQLNDKYEANEVLFCDDLCDSGLTIEQIKQIFIGAEFTTLIDKKPETDLVRYAPIEDSDDSWIVFPWE